MKTNKVEHTQILNMIAFYKSLCNESTFQWLIILTDMILLIYVANGNDDITTHNLVLCANKTSIDNHANYTSILVSMYSKNFSWLY